MSKELSQKQTATFTTTYAKKAAQNCLFISLSDLGITPDSLYDVKTSNQLLALFADLVVFTPSKQSHLGTKLKDYHRLTNRTTDKFLKDVFNGLGIRDVFLFNTFTPRKRNLKDIYSDVIKASDQMLLLRCDSGVKEALFMAIRNAIAHGNIVFDGRYFTLYSLANQEKEYESEISFLMRIDRLEKLGTLRKTLEAYR